MMTFSQIARSLPSLSLNELASLRALIDDEIEAREALALDAGDAGQGDGSDNGARGYIEIKMIKGRPYAYRRWREGRRLRSKYVGKVKR